MGKQFGALTENKWFELPLVVQLINIGEVI